MWFCMVHGPSHQRCSAPNTSGVGLANSARTLCASWLPAVRDHECEPRHMAEQVGHDLLHDSGAASAIERSRFPQAPQGITLMDGWLSTPSARTLWDCLDRVVIWVNQVYSTRITLGICRIRSVCARRKPASLPGLVSGSKAGRHSVAGRSRGRQVAMRMGFHECPPTR